jgi:glutamine cyclotransferase
MDRKSKLLLRLLGIIGFVVVLFALPVVGRSCGISGPTPLPPTPGLAVTPSPVGPAPTHSPLATPTAASLVSPLVSPLLSPQAPTAAPLLPTPTPLPSLPTAVPASVYTYRVVRDYPHDAEAFTQGLIYHDGALYESTGLYGRSSIRRVNLESGEVEQYAPLGVELFGEGIAIFGDRLYQLTWQNKVGFVWDWQSFDPLGQWTYEGEGWGLTHDGTHLIMSDGTPVLRFLDPETLQEVHRVEVRDGTTPVPRLNELEYVRGEVYANVWQTDRIARIDPESGAVVGWIDLSGLLSAEDRTQSVDVLNGIAYDAAGERLFVTGKLWPKLFEIEVVEKE